MFLNLDTEQFETQFSTIGKIYYLDSSINSNLLGQSPSFLKILKKFKNIFKYEALVLIVDETRTASVFISKVLRRTILLCQSMVGQPPDIFFENELFGHEKGVFPDAYDSPRNLVQVDDPHITKVCETAMLN